MRASLTSCRSKCHTCGGPQASTSSSFLAEKRLCWSGERYLHWHSRAIWFQYTHMVVKDGCHWQGWWYPQKDSRLATIKSMFCLSNLPCSKSFLPRRPYSSWCKKKQQWQMHGIDTSMPISEENRNVKFITPRGCHRYNEAPHGWCFDAIIASFRNKFKCVDDICMWANSFEAAFFRPVNGSIFVYAIALHWIRGGLNLPRMFLT